MGSKQKAFTAALNKHLPDLLPTLATKQAKREREMTNEEVLGSSSKGCGLRWPAWFTVEQMRAQLRHEEEIGVR